MQWGPSVCERSSELSNCLLRKADGLAVTCNMFPSRSVVKSSLIEVLLHEDLNYVFVVGVLDSVANGFITSAEMSATILKHPEEIATRQAGKQQLSQLCLPNLRDSALCVFSSMDAVAEKLGLGIPIFFAPVG